MSNSTFRLTAAAFCLITAFAAPAAAEEAGPGTVLATVNGTEITLGHIIALRSTLGPQYAQYPDEVLFNGILDQMIQQTLLQQSNTGKLSPLSQLSIENETRAITADEVIGRVTGGVFTEAELRAAYDRKFEQPSQEYRASHILLNTLEEAQALAERIEQGADFAALAREHSTGPSGPGGGDLGWFAEGRMVEPFFKAVTKLEKGEVSDPVETQFGWHLILLTDQRALDTPAFAEVRDQIEEELRNKAFSDFVSGLEASATITRAEPGTADPALINRIDLLEK